MPIRALLTITLAFCCAASLADVADPVANATSSKDITITVSGVEHLSGTTADALNRLATAIESLRDSGIELTDEDVRRVQEVSNSLKGLVESTGQNADKLTAAVSDSTDTLKAVTREMSSEVRQTVIDPSLVKAERLVDRARTTAVIALASLLALIVLVFVLLGILMARLFNYLQRLVDSHVIVPRSDWESRTSAADPALTLATHGRFTRRRSP